MILNEYRVEPENSTSEEWFERQRAVKNDRQIAQGGGSDVATR